MVKERIIVLAKTYPELSTKHGPIVCVAGINEYREWRRLYPIPFRIWFHDKYKGIKFEKWDVIEVDVTDNRPSHDPRFESREVLNWRAIKVVNRIEKWSHRLQIITDLLDPHIEFIVDEKRSLGVVKPARIENFYAKPRNRLREEADKIVLQKMEEADSRITLSEYFDMGDQYLLKDVKEPDIKIEELPWIGYKFSCNNMSCKGHEMMVIDWEAQELFRKYKTVEGPVKQKLYNEMINKRDLYFIVGNTWRYHKSFMIIGLFYPPKGEKPVQPLQPLFKERPESKILLDREES
jgi:hypothetical protein